MNIMNETQIYHNLNLPIEKQREYNLERYHFLSGILDILILHLRVEKGFTLKRDAIYRHFQKQQLNFKKEEEKFNAAIADLLGSNMIEMNEDGIIFLTENGLTAYRNQLFHNIAANLYAAERSDHLSKVAMISASILSVISIVCTIISICCNS